MTVRRALVWLGGGVALIAGLTACSSTVHVEPADAANDPVCAEVTVAMRGLESLAGQDKRWTDAQASLAWGDPTSIILRCGLPEPAPTSQLQCVTMQGVDWLVDATETPMLRLTSYGRSPAVQIYMDTEVVSGNDVIGSVTLANAVSKIPATGACTAPNELPDDVEQPAS